MAMGCGMASEASVVLSGSVYHGSPRYKSLIPNPEASCLTRDKKPGFLHFGITGSWQKWRQCHLPATLCCICWMNVSSRVLRTYMGMIAMITKATIQALVCRSFELETGRIRIHPIHKLHWHNKPYEASWQLRGNPGGARFFFAGLRRFSASNDCPHKTVRGDTKL